MRWFSVLVMDTIPPDDLWSLCCSNHGTVCLSVHPINDKSINHDDGRQSSKTLKYADLQFLWCSPIIASRVYNLTKQPWSLTIINLASNTPPLPFCLNNCPLYFPPPCPPFHCQHNPWLTSLFPNTSSLCWVSNDLLSSPEPTEVQKLFANQTDTVLD